MRFRMMTQLAFLGLLLVFPGPKAWADSEPLEVTEQGATEASKELPTCTTPKEEIPLLVSEFEIAASPPAKQRFPNSRCENPNIKQGTSCTDLGFVCLKHDRLREGCLMTWEYQYCTCSEMNGIKKYECHWGRQR